MESDQTNSLTAPSSTAVTVVVAVGATALAALNQVFESSTASSTVAAALMLSALWGGLFFDVYMRSRHKKLRSRLIDRPSHAPRLSTPHAFAN
jgi:hypothetical protein